MPRKPLHRRFNREIEIELKGCVEGVNLLGAELVKLLADNPHSLKQIVSCSRELVSYSERLLYYSLELHARRRLKD
jgi:hypothetical protein